MFMLEGVPYPDGYNPSWDRCAVYPNDVVMCPGDNDAAWHASRGAELLTGPAALRAYYGQHSQAGSIRRYQNGL